MNVSIYKMKDRESWRCQWVPSTGKRTVKDFKTETEANNFAKSLKAQAKKFGSELASVDLKDRIFLKTIKDIMAERNLSYTDIETLLRTVLPTKGNEIVPIRKAIDLFYADCNERGLRDKTLNHYRIMLESFEKSNADANLSDITAEKVILYITTRYTNPESRNTCRTPICAFLSWCADKQWISPDLAKKIVWREQMKDEKRVKFLTPEEAENLINSTPAKYQPSIALCLFAGLRPQGELQRIEWDAIDFNTKTISIGGEVAKTRAFRRMHNLPENLWKWLELCPASKRKGKIIGCNYRNYRAMFKKAREDAGILEFPHDGMRHSFASYGFHRGLEWAVDTMGHIAGFKTFVKHYKGASSKEDSDKYFSILP